LLPMLCRAGHITKTEIGAIRIHQMETHVELAPDCVESFLEAVGPSGKVDKNVRISRLEGIPDTPKGPRDRPQSKKRSYKDSKGEDRKKPKAHRKFSKESRDGAGDDKPSYNPKGKFSKKPKAKKPYKSSFDNPRPGTKAKDDSGSRPLKRKKAHKKRS